MCQDREVGTPGERWVPSQSCQILQASPPFTHPCPSADLAVMLTTLREHRMQLSMIEEVMGPMEELL